jgi:hypothetical protein
VSEAQNFGRPKVARTIEVAGKDGRPVTIQADEFGRPIGPDLPKPVEAKFIGLGGTTQAVDPYAAIGKTFQHVMTPEGRDASARGWAHLDLEKTKAAKADEKDKWQYDATRGLQINPLTGEARPVKVDGTPIGPREGTNKLTEDQGKATSWLERMKQAEDIIQKSPDWALTSIGSTGGAVGAVIGSVPYAGDTAFGKMMRTVAESPQRQAVRTAQEAWVAGLLRSDTGAAYKDMEKDDIIRTFFPQSGEGETQKALKAELRNGVMRAMAVRAGPGPKAMDSTPKDPNQFSDAEKERRYQAWKAAQPQKP